MTEEKKQRNRNCVITVLTTFLVIAIFGMMKLSGLKNGTEERTIKVGFVYIGDESTPYTYNFMRAEEALRVAFDEKVEILVKENVAEGTEETALRELVGEGCSLIFTTSYGYSDTVKRVAGEYPQVQFCQATGANANEAPVYENYHTFMGHIYEGRYVTGIVAGMKLKEMIEEGLISEEEALAGYVAAYPYPETISGYTAFFLGIRSVVPTARMLVEYTDSWSNYKLEKNAAKRLIARGCVVISQHSDTIGPAAACEEYGGDIPVYHVGYSQSMTDVAPTSSLISARINWIPYIVNATQAVLDGKRIEEYAGRVWSGGTYENASGKGLEGLLENGQGSIAERLYGSTGRNIHGQDVGGGFAEGWVELLELNTAIAPKGAQKRMEQAIEKLKDPDFCVFQGKYIGINPDDPSDTWNLEEGYQENADASAPSFYYVLKDVIEIVE